jgi:hypothetical protein
MLFLTTVRRKPMTAITVEILLTPKQRCMDIKLLARHEKMTNELRERLAKLEHQQWMHWTKWLVNKSDHDIPEELEEKWKKSWMPYEELSEEMKDKDRKWADKSLEEMKDFVEGLDE